MVRRLPLTTSCFAVWFSWYHVKLVDFVFMVLGCLILSISCSTWPPQRRNLTSHCLMSFISSFAIWFDFRGAKLLDLSCFFSCCWTFSTSCQAARFFPTCHVIWSCGQNATLFGLRPRGESTKTKGHMNLEIGERTSETCREVQTILIHREGVKMVAMPSFQS